MHHDLSGHCVVQEGRRHRRFRRPPLHRLQSLHARFAADAAAAVEINDAVVPLEQRGNGTYGDAGRVLAVIATKHGEGSPGVRIVALLDVFDPGSIGAQRHFILGLARDRASVAADTSPMVYYESVFHPRLPTTTS